MYKLRYQNGPSNECGRSLQYRVGIALQAPHAKKLNVESYHRHERDVKLDHRRTRLGLPSS